MASTRVIASAFTVIAAESSTGKMWLKLAPIDKDDVVHADKAAYLVPADRLDEIKALRASLKGVYDTLTEHIDRLATATPAQSAAPAQDTRVDALSAKVDALTEAMTVLAQLVRANTEAPANGTKVKAKAATPAPAADANPLADLPF